MAATARQVAARERIDAREHATRMREDDLLRGVLDTLRVRGWRTMHVRPARTATGWRSPMQGDGNGWPDVFAVRGTRLLALELKAQRGTVTDDQAVWLSDLQAAGVECYVIRPVDYPERIEAIVR